MICMDNNRVTKKVFEWDKSLNEANIVKTWYSEVKEVFASAGLDLTTLQNMPFNLKSIIETLTSSFKSHQKVQLEGECFDKPKLRTFIRFKNFEDPPAYTTKFLTFHQRRAMAKLRLGCLPLRIETGRYSRPRLDESERFCLLCKPAENIIEVEETQYPVEDEIHLLFHCSAYNKLRKQWYEDMALPVSFSDIEVDQKLRMVLNNSEYVKRTSQFILNCMDLRSKIVD